MLRHCAGSRQSADAADSLAAVVSPPYRQLHSGFFCRRSSSTRSACVLENLSPHRTTWTRTSVWISRGGSRVTFPPPPLSSLQMVFLIDLAHLVVASEEFPASEHVSGPARSSYRRLPCSPLVLLT